ncbi:MAG TPA: NYN domain-containing protein [Syntrophorhabdaceae bacterium]|nr:NYN domain-containing protein [Syntrophorhabdaceae bacterium]HQM80683.1 NYN domain-containing protein [Syntrophorhabdaceae bacterium]
MIHIIIDGYNYIGRTARAGIDGGSDLDGQRRSLLERLAGYKKYRSAKITVVFDAYNSFSMGRQRENFKGIDVVYSREGETADDVIIELIRSKRAGITVVSSDRTIIDEAKRHGVPFVTPGRLRETIAAGLWAEKAEDDDEGTRKEAKRGNPRRLPKRLRKVSKAISKL